MGWIFTQSDHERDTILNAEEVQHMAQIQARRQLLTDIHSLRQDSEQPVVVPVLMPSLVLGRRSS